MSKIYFLSFPAFLSLRKVLSSSQNFCHFSSTCATSYAALLATRLLAARRTGARSARAAVKHSISARIDVPLRLAALRHAVLSQLARSATRAARETAVRCTPTLRLFTEHCSAMTASDPTATVDGNYKHSRLITK